ncbi:DNA-binding response regulator [Cohnella sp. CIP 111063]|uniref:response regulator n=1 Tax=unclassified Cohnella TaxID=2636738 RepID=UPI000B8BE4B7|nr:MULTISPECIES: response regulator [unclassified Cohnella]OXS52864.1 DNA-binding response regulator [Cohnella sp. CIP 111063]PRX59837.1 two-component system response regulator YesN [Cohnella sp. SGD-V74]
MSRLLIVDDEPIAVEGLKSGVDWSGIGITRLFEAYSPDQAKEIFRSEPIDILLCDIEMPQGTGLELLEWVRRHYPRTETIFLTCHADFQYAKQAMQLGSLDYLLKPIPYGELTEAVRKAMRKLDQDNRLNEFSQYGKYWVKHQPLIVERFWLDILNQAIPGDAAAQKKAAEERNIPYSHEMTFVPVLIRIRRWYKEVSLRDEKVLEYAIRKSAEELLLGDLESGLLVSLGGGCMLALASGESAMADEERLRAACEKFVEACGSFFYAGVACYIGESAQGHHMASIYSRLRRLDANNVAYDQRVFSLHDPQASMTGHLPPDMSMWAVLLKEAKRAELSKAVEEYLKSQAASGQLNSDTLNRFVQDFQQMVYYVLQVKGIQAHQLFGDERSTELIAASMRSANDSLNWLRHMIGRSMEVIADVDQSQSVVDKVKAYVRENLDKDISREDIAHSVYLNPDYLTRIFKKETGLSISDYLLQQRLEIAAGLLINTEMSVASIAGKIGYANFSHFSRMFKKYMQLNPVEYRSKHQGERSADGSRESGREKS